MSKKITIVFVDDEDADRFIRTMEAGVEFNFQYLGHKNWKDEWINHYNYTVEEIGNV